MMDYSNTVEKTNRLQNSNRPTGTILDGGKLFNLCLNLYTGFPLLDKPREYIETLLDNNAQVILIGGNKFIHPKQCDTISAETVIDTVKHSTTGIFCQQIDSNGLISRSDTTLCAASLGLNKIGKTVSAAILFDPSYGNSTIQKESYYNFLSTLRELYTDLSKSRAVEDMLNNRRSYRYLVNSETGELIAKRLPTDVKTNNDNLAESIFRKIRQGHLDEEAGTAFDNQIKNLKITRFKLSRFEYLLFSFELPQGYGVDSETGYSNLFRCFAHRIKNKLGSLQTASSQLVLQAGNIIDDDDIALAEIIRSETEFIDNLITRTGKLVELEDPEFGQFDLIQTINEIIADNRKQFEQPVSISIQADNNECPVFGDRHLLKTALDEIIRNGYEADENITIEINNSENITITINNKLNDSMYDILSNKSLDITEPYVSLKPNQIGLGLSIASKIIALHEGQMETGLDINKGMIIKINLPSLTHPTHHISMENSRK